MLGGVLVGTVGWRAIFWVNVPVGLAAIALTQRFVPESRAPRPRRLDPIAQILIVVLLAGVTAGHHRGTAARLVDVAAHRRLLRGRRLSPRSAGDDGGAGTAGSR